MSNPYSKSTDVKKINNEDTSISCWTNKIGYSLIRLIYPMRKNVPVHILHLQLLRILSYRSLMTWLYMWRLFQLGSITLHAWAAEDFHCKMCHLRCKRFVRFDKIVKKSGFSINLLSTWHLGMCIYHHVPARHSTLPTKMYTMCGIAFLKCISYLELHS